MSNLNDYLIIILSLFIGININIAHLLFTFYCQYAMLFKLSEEGFYTSRQCRSAGLSKAYGLLVPRGRI